MNLCAVSILHEYLSALIFTGNANYFVEYFPRLDISDITKITQNVYTNPELNWQIKISRLTSTRFAHMASLCETEKST